MRTKVSQVVSSRKHYLKNRAARIADNKARKQRNHVFVQEYKQTHPCVQCGESEPCCLDFHHINPIDKFELIGRMADRGFSLDKIRTEILKCEILCANCHRKFHYGGLVLTGKHSACTRKLRVQLSHSPPA